MPIFEYRCADCGAASEVLIMGSAAEPESCGCGSGAAEKAYSAFSAHAPNGAPEACVSPVERRSGMCGMN